MVARFEAADGRRTCVHQRSELLLGQTTLHAEGDYQPRKSLERRRRSESTPILRIS